MFLRSGDANLDFLMVPTSQIFSLDGGVSHVSLQQAATNWLEMEMEWIIKRIDVN
jgi:hypothetical protein